MLSATPPSWARILLLSQFLLLIFYLPFIYLFYKNRTLYPITNRLPSFVLAFTFNLYIISFNELFMALYEKYYPCSLRYLIGINPYMCVFLIYNYRLLHLLFASKITENVLQSNGMSLSEWQENWYLQHRALVHPKKALYLFILTLFTYIFLSILFILLDDHNTLLQSCDFNRPVPLIWFYFTLLNDFIGCIITIVVGFLAYGAPKDAFWIKKEYAYSVYTGGTAISIFIIFTILGFPRWITSFFVNTSNLCVLFFAIVVPYLLSIKEQRLIKQKQLKSGCGGQQDVIMLEYELIDVLNNTEGFHFFLNYLETEFSTENLLFWDAVEQLKKFDPEDPSTPHQVGRIYFQFIADGSPSQVNLSHEVKEPILSFLQDLKHHSDLDSEERIQIIHIFDIAQENIYNLMVTDSYPRFQRTEQYRKITGVRPSPRVVGSTSHTEFEISFMIAATTTTGGSRHGESGRGGSTLGGSSVYGRGSSAHGGGPPDVHWESKTPTRRAALSNSSSPMSSTRTITERFTYDHGDGRMNRGSSTHSSIHNNSPQIEMVELKTSPRTFLSSPSPSPKRIILPPSSTYSPSSSPKKKERFTYDHGEIHPHGSHGVQGGGGGGGGSTELDSKTPRGIFLSSPSPSPRRIGFSYSPTPSPRRIIGGSRYIDDHGGEHIYHGGLSSVQEGRGEIEIELKTASPHSDLLSSPPISRTVAGSFTYDRTEIGGSGSGDGDGENSPCGEGGTESTTPSPLPSSSPASMDTFTYGVT